MTGTSNLIQSVVRLFKRIRGEHWRCFHCGEAFYSCEAANDHFGDAPMFGGGAPEDVACVLMLTTDQKVMLADNERLHREIHDAHEKIEGLEYLINGEAQILKAFKCQSTSIIGAFEEFSTLRTRVKIDGQVLDLLALESPESVARARATVCGEPNEWRRYVA